jgi:hypothetical protein
MNLDNFFSWNNFSGCKQVEIKDLSIEEIEKVLILKNLRPEIKISAIIGKVHKTVK